LGLQVILKLRIIENHACATNLMEDASTKTALGREGEFIDGGLTQGW
jgi:hypothetical protein